MSGSIALMLKHPLGKLPPNTRHLVELLQECLPPLEVCPGMDPDAVMFAAGARALVRMLTEAQAQVSQ